MKSVRIYTFSTCPYCVKAKALLEKKKVDYLEIDITNDRDRLTQLKEETGLGTVPQIFVGETFVGGCDDLYAVERSGELDTLLES